MYLISFNRKVTDMPDFRSAHVEFTETTLDTQGGIRLYTAQQYGLGVERIEIPLSFYRPASGLKDNDWLKDMLVQVIEQL